MTLRKFIQKLSRIKDELQDKEIVTIWSKGLEGDPEINFQRKDTMCLDLTKENIEKIVIC